MTDLVPIGIEESFEIDDVRMGYQSHDLEFTILYKSTVENSLE